MKKTEVKITNEELLELANMMTKSMEMMENKFKKQIEEIRSEKETSTNAEQVITQKGIKAVLLHVVMQDGRILKYHLQG